LFCRGAMLSTFLIRGHEEGSLDRLLLKANPFLLSGVQAAGTF
jgi:hypothetical protein